ncbi:oligosaccharide flippase family protein (plasmid) [Sphingobium yanoikuyae]|uniref:Oligosaccharide flippase family protein n=1 Tax=Sphingobium yanoikuyae TaxID=13690 RepID=A0A6P1GQ65_SPHYA|nr:oligosaccharide flippase family protein [Sphingobium yanoikuyae]QHD70737.1 oligosaccharide flippase family protein [Sphingobium yanoikuyae]
MNLVPKRLSKSTSGALWIFSERVLSSALNLLCIAAITRILGPAAYGHWAFTLSVIGVLLVAGDLGLEGLLIKKLVETPERSTRLLGTVFALKVIVYLPAIAAVLLFIWTSGSLSSEERSLFYIFMIPVILSPLTSSLLAWTNSVSAFHNAARMRMISNALGSITKIYAVFAGFGIVQVGWIHAGMFVLEAAGVLLAVRLLGGPMPWTWRPEAGSMRPLLAQSSYLFSATIFFTLYLGLGTIMMRFFHGPYEVGTYALVPQINQGLQFIPYALTLAVFPDLVNSFSSDKDRFYSTILFISKRLIFSSIFIILFLLIFSLFVFENIFGKKYYETVNIMILSLTSLPFLFLRQLTTKLYICINNGRELAIIEFIGLLLAVALNFIMVPLYGGSGAVIALSIVSAFTVILSFIFFDRGHFLRRLVGIGKSADNAE